MPTQCPWAEPAGPCSALCEPTFALWGGLHPPRAGLVPPRSCCDHWAHPELESCRGCQGWRCEEVVTALSMRAGEGKIPTGGGAGPAAVLSSWSCAAWLSHHVPQCHVPGVVPRLVIAAVSWSCPLPSLEPSLVLPQAFISQHETPSFPSRG